MSEPQRKVRRRHRPLEPMDCMIESLSHEGRGVAHHDGKVIFVEGALPGEQVRVQIQRKQARFAEGRAIAVQKASPDRCQPACVHADVCGGCSLQHMDSDAQLLFKQKVLQEQLEHFGQTHPQSWLEPLRDERLGYRRKARLGVRYVQKKESMLVGFREKNSNFLTEMSSCLVLDQRLGLHIEALKQMLSELSIREHIPQIECAAGDDTVVVIFRHLVDLPEQDRQHIVRFCQEQGWQAWGQRGGTETQQPLESTHPDGEWLYYELPDHQLKMRFHPSDFTQVHAGVNRKMLNMALDLLMLEPYHQVLDLFCGLGNFTLPLARRAAHVAGVEGSSLMTSRASYNAQCHGLDNVSFYADNLMEEPWQDAWAGRTYDRLLLDPPRSGAELVVRQIGRWQVQRLVYVSCNPATLARDAGILCEQGYVMEQAGVMDMFPHTSHVESIAVFERK